MSRVAHFLNAHAGVIIFSVSLFGFLWGYLHPGMSSRLTIFLPVTVFFMIYPVMVTVAPNELGRAFVDLRFLTVVALLSFLPGALAARALSGVFFAGRPDFAVGLILYSLLPTINALGSWVRSAGGNVTLSIVMLSVTQLLAIVVLPAGMWLLARAFVEVDPLVLIRGLVQIVVLPLVLGLLTRAMVRARYGERGLQFLLVTLPPYSVAGMAGTFFLIISRSAHDIIEHLTAVTSAILVLATLYVVQMLLGVVVAKWLRFRYEDGFVLMLGAAAKNTAIGVALASLYFNPLTVMVIVLAFIVQLPFNLLLSMGLTPQLQAILTGGAGSGDRAAPV
ncbi:MAG: bile acid:sodium symporter [Ardenticatenaceae bacterium]|nr:bile acid:sodium symporter [Ardenticatenaceae bacterium]